MNPLETQSESIAIIGMAGRFPGANSVGEFWRNLRDGVESVSFFKDEELSAAPLEGPPPLDNPNLVKARAVLENPDLFDAAFFNINPKEAEIMDPQHRVFLECAWETLENAGCNPDTCDGLIGLFAGSSFNTYLLANLLTNRELLKLVGGFQTMLASDKDYLPTRVSYKLNLRGPSLNVQTACSTSLVAVCLACQNLLNYQCDLALAGGVSIAVPQRQAHLHQEGGILSPDGHCRAFDAQAAGTMSGDGVGIVALKRLSDALADGDPICAVIKGCAINNDGSLKIGYTAPGIDGQAQVIAMAQANAGVPPDTISYIEAHGTGTPLGDPIEIAGLTKAFRVGTTAKGFCALGSVKSNIGHLDAAAGVAGLIKTVLALQNKQLPPSLHFQRPNPKIDFANSPFYVNDRLRDWQRGRTPRRAGVSSFGIGGTNAHVVLEEAPAVEPSGRSRHRQLLLLSARTGSALDAATANLVEHLRSKPDLNLADVAFTLQLGRKPFGHRRMLVCQSVADAEQALTARDLRRVFTGQPAETEPPVVFLFPGQGAQQVNMARGLYESEPVFRDQADRCCEILKPRLASDLRTLLYPGADRLEEAAQQLTQTAITQPALFVVEYALAQLWMSWGVRPQAMIGHSIGEYVAACLAGVFSLEDALALVAARGQLVQKQPPGAMLAVRLPDEEVKALLGRRLSLAAVNGPALCVASGPFDAVETLEKKLAEWKAACRRLQTSHAFHSEMMEPLLHLFTAKVRKAKLHPPQIPFISNVTGKWITAQEATDPNYWAAHLRQTVRFADGLTQLAQGQPGILLEVGPGQTLTTLARQHPGFSAGQSVVNSLGHAKEPAAEVESMLNALGRLWLSGVTVDWPGFYANERRHRLPLPTYPFERKRYWVEPARPDAGQGPPQTNVSCCRPETPDGREEKNRKAGEPPGDTAPSEPGGNETLSELKGVFGELSGVDLGRADAGATFLELGFDSLFLTQASQAVQKRFGANVTFRQLLEEFSTLEKLATHLDAQKTKTQQPNRAPQSAACPPGEKDLLSVAADVTPAVEPGVTPGGVGSCICKARPASQPETGRQDAALYGSQDGCRYEAEPAPNTYGENGLDRSLLRDAQAASPHANTAPLTDAQREIWFATQMGAGVSAAYNESCRLHFRGPLQAEGLRQAMQQLLERHEALRTTFSPSGETQRICAAARIDAPLADFAGLDERHREACVADLIDREVRREFDLVNGPLLRAQIVRLAADHHLLLLTAHHIVCDGWSLSVLLYELAELYSARCRGVPAALPAPMPFSAYARDRVAQQSTPEFAAAEAYWVKQFSDSVPVLELPGDRPRPATRTYAGSHQSRLLRPGLAAALKQAAAERHCTTFTLLLAAFQVLLHRLSGQDDIVVGAPAAGQVMGGANHLVGHCANLLPLRSRFDARQKFADYLAALRQNVLDAFEHHHYPFSRLIRKLNLARDPNRVPLANVTFNVGHSRSRLNFHQLAAEVARNPKRFVNFDINFNVTETDDDLALDCYFSTELFDDATIARLLDQYELLLESAVSDSTRRLFELPLLSERERRRLLVEWNDTAARYPRNVCVHELFEAQVERTPRATALICGTERLTYGELNRRANQLADRLQGMGVGPESLVGVCLERSPAMVVGLLAILKAGGAYVPIDPAYPRERMAFILEDARAPVVLTQESLRHHLPAPDRGHRFICLDSQDEARGQSSLQNPHSGVTSDNLAYVIYTSGSTGKPKGVALEHGSAVAFIHWAKNVFSPEELAGVLAATSICFDLSVFELFVPLSWGGAVILADTALQLPGLSARGEVTLINTVPSAIAELLRLDGVPGSVRTINLAGEPLSARLAQQLYDLGTIRKVYDLYGPSEDTTYSTFVLRKPNGPATIGRPIANTQVYLLDRHLQPVPVGVPGELCLAGDGLARGYLNRPELTAEKFIPNLFGGRSGARLYRTGDRARYLPDGNLEFLGRMDHQVKIRGYRIEPGEIESALAEHPALRENVVVARQDAPGEKRIVAYVVAKPEATLNVSALRDFLQKKLPAHLVPALFVPLARLPLTPNGKVDRRALPAPDQVRPDLAKAYVAPHTTTEEALAEIWSEVLGVRRIGVHDNFFELGGHSLLVTRVLSRVRQAFHLELSLRRFFDAPTIAQLAAAVEELLVQEIRGLTDEEAERLVEDPASFAKEGT